MTPVLLVPLFFAGLTACAVDAENGVQELRDGSWRDVEMSLASATGSRDGETTHAVFRFEGAAGGSLDLEVDVVVSPQAELRSGRWRRRRGDDVETGSAVRALSLRFLGGQGGNVSVGGRFLLVNDAGERWRVELGPTVLERREAR